MGLFNSDKEKAPANPNNMLLFRMLVVGYLLYTVYTLIKMYIEGGEDQPSLWMLIGAVVLFVGGSVWTGIETYKQYKRLKEQQQAAYEEEERLLAQNEEDYEDEFDDGEDAEENKD